MPRPDLSVVDVLARLGGCATYQEILTRVPRRELLAAVSAGTIRKVARGTYALPELPPARQMALRVGGVISRVSAAQVWKLDLLVAPTSVHLTVRPNAHPPRLDGVTLAWSPLSRIELEARVTSPVRTVIDCAATLPFAEGLAVADSALRSRLVTRTDLLAEAASRRGRGAPAARRVAEHADGRAANPFESALRAIVLDEGLHGFVPQFAVDLPSGRIFSDLGHKELQMLIEADSFTWHGGRADLERDCRRYNEAVRGRWVVLRAAWEHVLFERVWLGRVIHDVADHQRAQQEDSRRRGRSLRVPQSRDSSRGARRPA